MAKTVSSTKTKVSKKGTKISGAEIKSHISTSNTSDANDLIDSSIENKLIALYKLQRIDSQIDKIKIIRGELPLEVEDLEDEVIGLKTRIDNFIQDIENYKVNIKDKQEQIKQSLALIKRYEDQQMNVRNNREYDSLTKEIEFQSLEIAVAEKKIKQFSNGLETKKSQIETTQIELNERNADLEIKKSELLDIINETEKEENTLLTQSNKLEPLIEDRLLIAYKKIRNKARNGLAVVAVERDACGGCFNYIPPQIQLDIRMHKKIIVCEYCGRILIDGGLANEVEK